MNMVKFANAVVGTGVENWQAAGASMGFSRYSMELNFLLKMLLEKVFYITFLSQLTIITF